MSEHFILLKPDDNKTRVPVVFDSPHSGRVLPRNFKPSASKAELDATRDAYVDELFACAPNYGATLLKANFSRSYLDLNRMADDIDPALLGDAGWTPKKPKDENAIYIEEIKPTTKSASGIGLIRRLIKPGVPVYDRTLTTAEIVKRIDKYYRPYHQTLLDTLNKAHYNYGQVYHMNCHSMPSAHATPKRAIGFVSGANKQVDFCIGNRDGMTAGYEFTNAVKEFLKDLGYVVSINDPYKGVSLIGNYASPMAGRHALQLEINRALYMDEDTLKKNKNYKALKADIEKLVEFTCSYAQSKLSALAAD